MKNFEQLDEPEKISISKIVELANEGDLGIPEFQRDFTWDRNDVADLFESIFRGYYIGSLLFWSSGESPKLESQPIRGVMNNGNFTPKYLVLDGQQRISSIHYALKVKGSPLWNYRITYSFFLDLNRLLDLIDNGNTDNYENEEKLVESLDERTVVRKDLNKKEVQFKMMKFPLIELQDYQDWIYDFRRFLVDEGKKAKTRPLPQRKKLGIISSSCGKTIKYQ